jgi:pimeloyl-ACP methyl ester carboxylesterase
VVTKNKIQKAILIGNSLGGQIACVLAAKYPEQYSKLILISSSGLFLETREFKKSFPIWTINNRLKAKEILNSVFYRKHLITDELIDDVFSVVSDKERKKGLIKTIQKTKDYDISEFLLKIMQPTLIFWGQRDEIIPINVANIFKKLIPNSKLLIEPNCGHALQMEAPSFFVVNSESFIDK